MAVLEYAVLWDDTASFIAWLRYRLEARWMRDAACREHPELSWFPARGASTAPAKAVCRACLVRRECLECALDDEEDGGGVWGGYSEPERRAARARGWDARRMLVELG